MASAKILDWVENTQYQLDEVVTVDASEGPQFNSRLWRCILAHTSNSFQLDFSNSKWEEIVIKGTQGEQGDVGLTGLTGPSGTNGSQGSTGAAGADGVFSEIATQAEAEVGAENTKGMTALRTKQAFDEHNSAHQAAVIALQNDSVAQDIRITDNTNDIAAIVIDSAQITTNKNDIAGNVLDIAQNATDISNIVIDNAQITTNQNDINTINTVTIPNVDADIDRVKARLAVVENATNLTFASGQQRVNNSQAAAQEILGSDLEGSEAGKGNRFELNPVGALSAKARVEIYRKDDTETRFTVAELELHFVDGTWYIGRFKTLVLMGDDDGLNFSVAQDVNEVATVSYTSDDMVGGNYSQDSYLKFELKEISNF